MEFEILYALIMGVLQGLTEWLPVSSSGHLAITQELFGIRERTLFDAILHLGTLLSVTVYFRSDIKPLMNLKNPNTRVIILASLPIIIIGFLIKDYIETAFSFVLLVGIFLIINGFMLMLNLFVSEPKQNNTERKKYRSPMTKAAMIIGVFQVFALFPGISRSGTTITTGRVLGLDWKRAAKFSFFISIIPVAGAAWFKLMTSYHEFELYYLVGFFAAFIVGYSSIDIMMRLLQAGRFHYFGIYTVVLGVLVLVYLS